MSSLADMAFPLRLSLQVALCSTLLAAVVGTTAGYLLASRSFRGKGLIETLLTLPMVLPPVVVGYYLLLLVGRNGALGTVTAALLGEPAQLTFTWYAAVLASFAVSVPFTIKSARAAIASIDPALVRQSRVLGHGELTTAWRVVLPLARKGIAAGIVLSFARALGEFGATAVVAGNIPGRTNTMPLEIYNMVMYGGWRDAAGLVVVFSIISVVVLYVAGRFDGSEPA